MGVILSDRGPKCFLQLGGGESKDLQFSFRKVCTRKKMLVAKVEVNGADSD
jgi:hypothetical protein